jgi:hypothetical protein
MRPAISSATLDALSRALASTDGSGAGPKSGRARRARERASRKAEDAAAKKSPGRGAGNGSSAA